MRRPLLYACLAAASLPGAALPSAAAEIDEKDLFGKDTTVSSNRSADQARATNVYKLGASWSGSAVSRTRYTAVEAWWRGQAGERANSFASSAEADFLVDVRFNKGIKAFLDLAVQYSPQGLGDVTISGTNVSWSTNRTRYTVKEFFVDVNLDRALYLRVGKQVLQWGRGFFWNPSDLLNVERKDFLDLNRKREGAYGLKLQAAAGSWINLYGVVDASDGKSGSDLAVAGKAEFLVGITEFSFSAWGKPGNIPVYGFEFATRALGLDWYGEAAASYGDDRVYLRRAGAVLAPWRPADEWSLRACLGAKAAFDWDLKDRIQLTAELFYNNLGYDWNLFTDPSFTNPLFQAQRALFLATSFEPNYNARWYAALFATVAQFLDSSLTLTANVVANLVDGSATVALGLGWAPVNDFSAGFALYGGLGTRDGEYAGAGLGQGRTLALDVTLSMVF